MGNRERDRWGLKKDRGGDKRTPNEGPREKQKSVLEKDRELDWRETEDGLEKDREGN